jgi:exosortase H (IPTLxxWG-CTERM-specific)
VVAWYRAKNPVLMFVLLFGLLMGAYYAATLTPLFHQTLFPTYLRWNARVSGVFLNWLGQATIVTGSSIASGRFSIDVRRGCDAIEPSMLFLSAVLAFPGAFRRKFPGLLLGTLALLAINLVRIVTLVLTGVYYPGAFETMHADVWQILFILLAIIFWTLWVWRSMRRPTARPHVPG